MRIHNRGYPEESATCRNNYSLMFSLSSQYSQAIAFLTSLLSSLRITAACFRGRLPRLHKPKYFILREARDPLCQGARTSALRKELTRIHRIICAKLQRANRREGSGKIYSERMKLCLVDFFIRERYSIALCAYRSRRMSSRESPVMLMKITKRLYQTRTFS